MNEIVQICLVVCPLVFLAGFVDAVAGGGGVISLPAYMLAGVPVHQAMGTNKAAMSMAALVSSYQYTKNKKLDYRAAGISAVGSLVGGWIGSHVALLISEEALKIAMLVILPAIAIFLSLRKDFGKRDVIEKQMASSSKVMISLGIGLSIGCYDGLIGPGTGTFFLLAFTGFLGFDLLKSSGCARVSNLASNLASLITFLLNKKVVIGVAVPAAIFAMSGSYIGSKLALKKGNGFVRIIIFVVLGLLIAKMVFDLAA